MVADLITVKIRMQFGLWGGSGERDAGRAAKNDEGDSGLEAGIRPTSHVKVASMTGKKWWSRCRLGVKCRQ